MNTSGNTCCHADTRGQTCYLKWLKCHIFRSDVSFAYFPKIHLKFPMPAGEKKNKTAQYLNFQARLVILVKDMQLLIQTCLLSFLFVCRKTKDH